MPPKPPKATLSISATGVVGIGIIADPTLSRPSAGATLKSGTIGWGDGDTTAWSGKPAKESHIYQKEGLYTVVLTIWDTKGMSGSTTASITVMPPTPLPPAPQPPPIPAAPTNVVASPGDSLVTVQWSP